MGKTCLCIDVGGSSIKYAKINENLELSDYGKVKTPYEGPEKYLDTLAEIYRLFAEQVDGISLAVPGMIDSENGICISAGALHFADGLHLVDELEKRCHCPIAIMNDAKSAALAEAGYGVLKDCKDGIVIALGTGIGGALIKDGKVHMGKHFAAGEFSFIPMTEHVDIEANSWAGINGNPRLLAMTAKVKKVRPEELTGEDVFRFVEEGDEQVIMVLDQFTRSIARMIMILQSVYDPERIAIGGGISRQPALLASIRRNLDYFYTEFPVEIPRAEVVTCQFFNEANLIGAYVNYKNKIW